MDLKYKNITVSGGVAVGKGSLKDNLKSYLEPLGWKFTSAGQLNRDHSKEYISPTASKVGDDFNLYLEKRTKDLLNEGQYVIEAWLSGFVARDIPNTLKVLLICSADAVRIDRVANRDKITVDQAKDVIKKRESDNMEVWNRLYGKQDFFNPKNYDLVIDTYSSGQMETVGKVLDKLGYNHK